MIVTVRYSDRSILYDKMQALGVPCNPDADKIEESLAYCSTPELVTTVGIVRSLWLTEEQYVLLPGVTSPEFLVDWSEDCEDADGNPLPWPMYTVEGVDINGNPVQFQQGAGMFA